jgi:hypothetical protein
MESDRSIIVSKRYSDKFLVWATWIQSTISHKIFLRSILILSSSKCLGFSSHLSSSGFQTIFSMHFSYPQCNTKLISIYKHTHIVAYEWCLNKADYVKTNNTLSKLIASNDKWNTLTGISPQFIGPCFWCPHKSTLILYSKVAEWIQISWCLLSSYHAKWHHTSVQSLKCRPKLTS